MKSTSRTQKQLVAENEDLRARLNESEETLRAIRSREVDALIISGVDGEQIITLEQAEQEIASLARFLSENPNPVLRLSRDGILMYANAASGALLGLWGCAVGGSAPQFWHDLVTQVLASRENKRLDIECDGKVYSMFVTPIAELGYVNLYGRNTTERKRAEEAMYAANNLLDKTFASLNEAVFIVDPNTRTVITCNGAVEHNFGYTEKDVIGRTTEFMHVDRSSFDRFGQELFPVLDAAGMFHTEFQMRRKDGSVFPTENTVTEIKDNLGRRTSVVSVVRDITERKQAEETLQKSEKRFRALVEHSMEEISLVDSDGTLTWESPTLRRPLGYPPNSFVGHNLFDLFHPDERAAATRLLEQSVKHPGSVHEALFRLRHQDGSWRWIEGFLTNLLDELAVQSVVINYRDITERKHAENKLRESEERFRSLYENVTLGIYRTTPSGEILLANQALINMLGYSSFAELSQRNLEDEGFEPEYERNIFRQTIESDGEVKGLESAWKRKDGVTLFVRESSKAIQDAEGKFIYYEGTVEDITERKRAELEIVSLAKFLSENPNPVLRLSRDGILMYANAASGALLGMWGCGVGGSAPQFWCDLAAQALASMENKTVDAECDGKVYSMFVTPIAEPGYVNLYGSDITERKQAEERIRWQLSHLTAISGIGRVISANYDLKLSLTEILTHVTIELGIDAADILILKPNSQILEYGAERGFRTKAIRKAQVHLGESYAGRAALERQLVKIPNLREEPDNHFMTTLLADEGFVCYYGVPLIVKGQVKGVLGVFHRSALEPDAEWFDFLYSLAGQAAIAVEIATLFESLQRSNSDLTLAYDATIEGWSHALDLRDKETEGHTRRVTDMAVKLGRAFGLSEANLAQVRWGALLHDIGKLGVPDRILLKPGPLTAEEWVIMKKHPFFAYEMLSPIRYLRLALDIPYCHHENWDGTGYPHGLKGTQIPLVARIFAVVDVWDALRSDRPYRAGWPEEQVLEYIRVQAGTQFDPKAVELLFQVMSEKGHEPKQRAGL